MINNNTFIGTMYRADCDDKTSGLHRWFAIGGKLFIRVTILYFYFRNISIYGCGEEYTE